MTTVCSECQKTFDSEHNLKCHQYRELNKPPAERCGVKRERKLKMIEAKERKTRAKQQIQESGLTHIVETANESSRTNELLQQLQDQMGEIKEQNNHLKDKVYNIEQQNNDLKEMVTEFARNPKLLVLVDKLYPIQSLREVDLKMPAFKPVLEILDNELPEYANLAQEKTGKVHCKAVRKLNEIQPTTVKDEEKLFCKDGDVITKADNMDTTKQFINVMANSGFEYAQKASVDLKSKRESDQPFLETILKNASCDTIQNLQEIVSSA
jgi:cell division protein FtsB